MRKLAAALLLSMLLFNWIGYSFVADYLQYNSDQKLEKQLDASLYNEEDLIELKLAINLPYQSNWTDYERYDGEIDYNGVSYKYVKRKVANDTLYLKCIPNEEKMSIKNAKSDFFKMTNDLAQNDHSKKSPSKDNVSKNISKDFYDDTAFVFLQALGGVSQLFKYTGADENIINQSPHSPEQPPDNIA